MLCALVTSLGNIAGASSVDCRSTWSRAFDIPGRGIMSTALDGPRTEVKTIKNGTVIAKRILRRPVYAADVTAEMNSKDQT